ncbi:hypothetical protein [Streptomyces sp. SID10815]|uniref:hypothetical protein n=1 Tax=Streptomyces sp. SID10815 TaxID=2706027 RepID=UPI0019446D1C|nr:hypothetical protein [Streptomyces sp. SID10815]
MPDLWMPGAERRPVGNTDVMNGGPARATWHATSNTNDWSYKNESAYFAAGGAGMAPHLIVDPFTGQICQYFPADSRALALKNADGERTNRTGKYNIQIEVVFTPGETVNGRRYANIADTPCKGIPEILAWLRSLGIPDAWPGGAPRAWARQTVSLDTWRSQAGHYGHCHVPGNDHIDPGPMPAFTTTPAPEEDMTPDQAKQLKALYDVLTPYGGWDYKGKGETRDAYAYLRDTSGGVKTLTAQVGALTATVGKLAQGGGLDAAEIKAAAEAGAQAALAKLGDALKEA